MNPTSNTPTTKVVVRTNSVARVVTARALQFPRCSVVGCRCHCATPAERAKQLCRAHVSRACTPELQAARRAEKGLSTLVKRGDELRKLDRTADRIAVKLIKLDNASPFLENEEAVAVRYAEALAAAQSILVQTGSELLDREAAEAPAAAAPEAPVAEDADGEEENADDDYEDDSAPASDPSDGVANMHLDGSAASAAYS